MSRKTCLRCGSVIYFDTSKNMPGDTMQIVCQTCGATENIVVRPPKPKRPQPQMPEDDPKTVNPFTSNYPYNDPEENTSFTPDPVNRQPTAPIFDSPEPTQYDPQPDFKPQIPEMDRQRPQPQRGPFEEDNSIPTPPSQRDPWEEYSDLPSQRPQQRNTRDENSAFDQFPPQPQRQPQQPQQDYRAQAQQGYDKPRHQPQRQPQQVRPVKKEKSKAWIYILAVVLGTLVGALGVGSYLYYQKHKDDNPPVEQDGIDNVTDDDVEALDTEVLPDYSYLSDTYLNEESLDGKSRDELRKMRSAIYAMHGYKFRDQDLTDYFSQYDWYEPKYSDVTSKLNAAERHNIDLIKAKERKVN